jgi:MFS transporter, FHS family, L-fucose permease
MGFVADHAGLTLSFLVPLVCYAYIAHYGFRGHALR